MTETDQSHKPHNPKHRVGDYFMTLVFARRGSIHIPQLTYLKDAPQYGKVSEDAPQYGKVSERCTTIWRGLK